MSPAPHRFRSPLLGERLVLDLPQGTLEAFRRGNGPPLVFAHGRLANANLWRGVVDRLADRFTCVALDLPLGAHRVALDPGADLTPAGCGALTLAALDALDALGLGEDVTLVGNDSGGAYSQIAVAAHPQRSACSRSTACRTTSPTPTRCRACTTTASCATPRRRSHPRPASPSTPPAAR